MRFYDIMGFPYQVSPLYDILVPDQSNVRLPIGQGPRERRPPLPQIMTLALPLGETIGGHPS